MYNTKDNIVAVATNPSGSTINIIRTSGPSVVGFYKKLCKAKNPPLANSANMTLVYDLKEKTIIDQAVVSFFRSPNSFTGEDVVEYSLHGGVVVVRQFFKALLSLGCRPALAGEFSYRAFLNGKIDLIQAESINALIKANNNIDAGYAVNNLQGALSKKINEVYDLTIKTITGLEHELDFNEDEIAFSSKENTILIIKTIIKKIDTVLKKSFQSNAENRGIKICIAGKTNVGKSSLFNTLLGKERSITSKEAGTTRDTIESNITLNKNNVTLIDTAGVRKTKHKIEQLGVGRSFSSIKEANILVFVDDVNPIEVFNFLGMKKNIPIVFVKSKCDKTKKQSIKGVVQTSCLNVFGLKRLSTEISTAVSKVSGEFKAKHAYLLNERQYFEISLFKKGLLVAVANYKKEEEEVVLLSGLYSALHHLQTTIKPIDRDYVLNEVFGGFCVGK